MKTVNKNNVCERFTKELDRISGYVDRCKSVFKEEDLYLTYSYENAILMVYKAFEVFIERLLVSCLNHDHSYFEEKYGIALGKHINDDVCEFLITKGGFFDFKGYGGLIKILGNTLGSNHNLITVIKETEKEKGKEENYQTYIDQLCAIRNYAAHNSKQSKQSAKKAFGVNSISSAGSCLKQQNRFTTIVGKLKTLSNEVQQTDIY